MLSVGGVAAKFLAAIVGDRSAATNCTAGRHQNRRIALPLSESACMLNPFQPGNDDVVFSSRFGGQLATGRRGLRIAKLVISPLTSRPMCRAIALPVLPPISAITSRPSPAYSATRRTRLAANRYIHPMPCCWQQPMSAHDDTASSRYTRPGRPQTPSWCRMPTLLSPP